MKADFKHLKVRLGFEDEYQEMDVARVVGNAIRQHTADIGVGDTARLIYYSEGEIDIPDEHVREVAGIIGCNFNIPVQEAVNEMLGISENHAL